MAELDIPFAFPCEVPGASKAVEPRDLTLLPAKPNWVPLMASITFCFLADLFVCPLMTVFNQRDWGAVWVYMCFGVIAAQGAIASSGLVWIRGPFLIRFALHWSAVAFAWALWWVGTFASVGFSFRRLNEFHDREIWAAFWLFPILALSIQLPLWLVGQYFGWRLTRTGTRRAQGPNPALTIRGLLIATMVVALSMMGARMAASWDPSESVWIGLAIAVAGIGAVSTISVLPISIWMLKWSNWQRGLALVAIEAIIGAFSTTMLIYGLGGRRSGLNAWELTGLTTVIVSYFAICAAVALSARSAGYRLQTGRGLSENEEALNLHAISNGSGSSAAEITQPGNFGKLN